MTTSLRFAQESCLEFPMQCQVAQAFKIVHTRENAQESMQTQLVQMFAYVDSTCSKVNIYGLNLLRGQYARI